MEIEMEKEFRWPESLRGDSEKRDKGRYSRFHKDVGKLGRFTKGEEVGGQKRDNDRRRRDDDRRGNDRDHNPQPQGPVINMILGDPTSAGTTRNSRKVYARLLMSIVKKPSKRFKSEITLEFSDPDLEGLKFTQDEPLVITLVIGNCPVLRVLVDNGDFMDIQFHDTFLRIGYNDSQLTSSNAPTYGFNQVKCKVEGAIQLPVNIREEPREAIQMLNFHVVKATSTYNAIMGRTWIHAKVVLSTYHMVLKFSTKNFVGEAKEDHKMAHICYVAAFRQDETGRQVPP
ncbi:uncharacterized protein LOC141665416 [Apium graveolens]|uniref:uncharacterized protein LOC141665416 n=1 Tax=Apium graveolens TaxID=4045 RepID=UPI003D7B88C1